MKTLFIGFVFFVLLFACSDEKNEVNYDYLIKAEETPKPEKEIPPRPPMFFYGEHNFILIDTSKIYYHNKYVYHWCGTGIDDSKPPKLFLVPDSLKEIKISNLKQFLNSLRFSPTRFGKHSFASISSPTDTIRNKAFKTIRDFLNSQKIVGFKVRRLTEEEQYVSQAKLENKAYNPYEVDWKTGFDSDYGMGETIEFLPLKAED